MKFDDYLKTLDWDLLCSWPISTENLEGVIELVELPVIYPPDDEGVVRRGVPIPRDRLSIDRTKLNEGYRILTGYDAESLS